jgi:hypothetical protein
MIPGSGFARLGRRLGRGRRAWLRADHSRWEGRSEVDCRAMRPTENVPGCAPRSKRGSQDNSRDDECRGHQDESSLRREGAGCLRRPTTPDRGAADRSFERPLPRRPTWSCRLDPERTQALHRRDEPNHRGRHSPGPVWAALGRTRPRNQRGSIESGAAVVGGPLSQWPPGQSPEGPHPDRLIDDPWQPRPTGIIAWDEASDDRDEAEDDEHDDEQFHR